MNPVHKVDVVLENISPDLTSIAPRKTIVHVEERDGEYVVLTEDDRYIGVLKSEINDKIYEYDVEIRSVKHATPAQPIGHVLVRLRKKSTSKEAGGHGVKPIGDEVSRQQQQQQQEEEDLELFSKEQLEMLVSRKDLREVFVRDKGLGDWVKRVVEADNPGEKEAVVQQLLSDPESSQLIDFVMNELS